MQGVFTKKIHRFVENRMVMQSDDLAVEEPLEIQLAYWEGNAVERRQITITMRTPGADAALALGFLYAEQIIHSLDEVAKVAYLPSWQSEAAENRIVVGLHKGVTPRLDRMQRHFYSNSSCGVCGKASIDSLQMDIPKKLLAATPHVDAQHIPKLPLKLQQQQGLFEQTGGIHAAGLFDVEGNLLILEEDVGRHNAVDKLIGTALQRNMLPLQNHILQVSGRASFELVQKAWMAEISILSAVGAPSSLAVRLAEQANMTLIGFVKAQQFNIYTGAKRVLC